MVKVEENKLLLVNRIILVLVLKFKIILSQYTFFFKLLVHVV